MAKAIQNIEKSEPDELALQGQAIQELLGAVVESKDALVVFLDILKEAHEAGLLNILQGLLKTRQDVAVLALEQLNQPSMHHTIQNVTHLAKFFGKMNPDQLNRILNGIAHGIEKTAEPKQEKTTGLWSLSKNLRDSDVNSTLSTAIGFMKGMGAELRKDDKPPSVH